ncbi:microtubule-associated protein 1a light chain, putative [Bodo saltans]|uniref:Autophagy-related protein n=1 Tax=Bodo saltans TaxID=75058 RepID=A0A0S4JA79_BODSA|nr:microtubule-associated protein 1a light chain, putative [Bodo saltans]|eukprot:CUG86839.1 microtubule-associated protein 1a light chain, putative [Bodo saltans]
MANKKFQSKYKAAHTFEYRKSEADKVRERHPDRLPVICEKVENSNITDLDKNKFLVPSDLTVGQFVLVVRKRVMLEPEKAVFLFIGESVPPNAAQMSDLYAKYKDEDGFLYVKYSGENTFGASA